MYERMLDGQTQPSYEEFTEYCGERKALLEKADDFLINQLHAEKEMRFPYGKHYGQFDKMYEGALLETKKLIDNKYPCGSGGWIHYRVLTWQQLEDVFKMLRLKAGIG